VVTIDDNSTRQKEVLMISVLQIMNYESESGGWSFIRIPKI